MFPNGVWHGDAMYTVVGVAILVPCTGSGPTIVGSPLVVLLLTQQPFTFQRLEKSFRKPRDTSVREIHCGRYPANFLPLFFITIIIFHNPIRVGSTEHEDLFKESEGFDWLGSTEQAIDKRKFLINRFHEKQPTLQDQDWSYYECYRVFFLDLFFCCVSIKTVNNQTLTVFYWWLLYNLLPFKSLCISLFLLLVFNKVFKRYLY